jgi:hypothetical protein
MKAWREQELSRAASQGDDLLPGPPMSGDSCEQMPSRKVVWDAGEWVPRSGLGIWQSRALIAPPQMQFAASSEGAGASCSSSGPLVTSCSAQQPSALALHTTGQATRRQTKRAVKNARIRVGSGFSWNASSIRISSSMGWSSARRQAPGGDKRSRHRHRPTSGLSGTGRTGSPRVPGSRRKGRAFNRFLRVPAITPRCPGMDYHRHMLIAPGHHDR